MNGKQAKRLHRYAKKLIKIHPDIYKDRTKPVRGRNGRTITLQRYSGWRLAKKHARFGMQLEK